MSADVVRSSELSSMAASVDDLVRRVARIGEAASRSDADRVPRGGKGALSVSQELFEAERALTDAARRLANTAEALKEAGRG
ncbi:MAG: hypothetical protein ACR2HV_10925 [Acidimicrobiales bacterium]